MSNSFEMTVIFGLLCVIVAIYMVYRYRSDAKRQEHELRMKELEARFAHTQPVVRPYNEDAHQERILERRLREHREAHSTNEYGNPRAFTPAPSSPPAAAPFYPQPSSRPSTYSAPAQPSGMSSGVSLAAGVAAGAAAALAAEALYDRLNRHEPAEESHRQHPVESQPFQPVQEEKPFEVAELERVVAEEAAQESTSSWTPRTSTPNPEPAADWRNDSASYDTPSGGSDGGYSGGGDSGGGDW